MPGRDWLNVLETFGVSVLIITFMGACVWKGGSWIGTNVIKPIVERYIILLDALIASVTKQGETMVKVGSTLEKEGDTLSEVGAVLRKLGETLDQMGQHVIRSMDVLANISEGVSELRNVKDVRIHGAEKVEVISPEQANITTQPTQQQPPQQPKRKNP